RADVGLRQDAPRRRQESAHLRAGRQAGEARFGDHARLHWFLLPAGVRGRLRNGSPQPLPRASLYRRIDRVRLIGPDQALEVIELEHRPRRIAKAAANLIQHFTRLLDVDLVGDLDAEPEVRAVAAVGPPERVLSTVALAFAGLGLAVLHHLLGERLSALAQLVQRAALLVGGAVEIRLAKRVRGVAHGFA